RREDGLDRLLDQVLEGPHSGEATRTRRDVKGWVPIRRPPPRPSPTEGGGRVTTPTPTLPRRGGTGTRPPPPRPAPAEGGGRFNGPHPDPPPPRGEGDPTAPTPTATGRPLMVITNSARATGERLAHWRGWLPLTPLPRPPAARPA